MEDGLRMDESSAKKGRRDTKKNNNRGAMGEKRGRLHHSQKNRDTARRMWSTRREVATDSHWKETDLPQSLVRRRVELLVAAPPAAGTKAISAATASLRKAGGGSRAAVGCSVVAARRKTDARGWGECAPPG